MIRLLIMSLFILITACSHSKPSVQVRDFVQSWSDQYKPNQPLYSDKYKNYLMSVENIYKKHEKSEKFRSYLDSLNINSQILAHQESALPGLYKQQTGRSVASSDRNFIMYRNKEMSALDEKLFTARELKLQDEVGPEMFDELHRNYEKFMNENSAQELNFPL